MEEYTTYGKPIMKKLREILLNYKNTHNLTNAEMATKCDLSISEYDKIININRHSKYGCSVDTFSKICSNLDTDANFVVNIIKIEQS